MSEFNPYAPPEESIAPPAPRVGVVGRDGSCLVFAKGAALPDRCLWCNQPAEGYRLRRTLYWHAPIWYFVALLPSLFTAITCMGLMAAAFAPLFLLISYVVVSLCVRQTAEVAAPLCAEHQARRRRAIAIGWTVSLGAIAVIVAGTLLRNNAVGIPGLFLLPVGILVGAVGAQVASPTRIDRHHVWLKASPAFLADLPDWHATVSTPPSA